MDGHGNWHNPRVCVSNKLVNAISNPNHLNQESVCWLHLVTLGRLHILWFLSSPDIVNSTSRRFLSRRCNDCLSHCSAQKSLDRCIKVMAGNLSAWNHSCNYCTRHDRGSMVNATMAYFANGQVIVCSGKTFACRTEIVQGAEFLEYSSRDIWINKYPLVSGDNVAITYWLYRVDGGRILYPRINMLLLPSRYRELSGFI